MTVVGKARKYHKKFKFLIEIDGFASFKFTKASEIKGTAATVEASEGGDLFPQKDAGRVTFPPVTFERGAGDDEDMWNWWKEVCDAARNAGLTDDEYKRTIDVVQLDRNGDELRRWTLYEAFPKEFTAGEWDNNADENVVEMLQLEYRYFDKVA